MDKIELIINEIKDVPEPYIEELLDFIYFLKIKMQKEILSVTILSEFSLNKDWLKPEEDEAWQSL
jgi:hypothetical protein